ncbi:hypothetical protein OAF24_03410 [bacterium]|jgi:hypothetical protein|nr:hypothetical protein [bacterium]
MIDYSKHYRTGEEIRPGDKIRLAGYSGIVRFVLELPGVPAGWEQSEEWLGTEKGFMLEVESMGLVFNDESDEDLDFVARKT